MDRPHSLTFEFYCATDRGRVRTNNEDSVALDESAALVVLADGMGGYNAGEVASGMATTFVKSELGRWLTDASLSVGDHEVRRAMDICVDNANRAIFNAANTHAQYAGMGTTLVMAWLYDNRMCVAHVGDSRLYRLREGCLEQVTRDHSLLQEQLDSGMISPAQARAFHSRNLVTRAVGVEPGVEPEIQDVDVQVGDVFLLCSDGLSDMMEDGEIARTLREYGDDPAIAADRLVEMANDNGGRDNVSVIVVKVRGEFPATTGKWQKLLSRLGQDR